MERRLFGGVFHFVERSAALYFLASSAKLPTMRSNPRFLMLASSLTLPLALLSCSEKKPTVSDAGKPVTTPSVAVVVPSVADAGAVAASNACKKEPGEAYSLKFFTEERGAMVDVEFDECGNTLVGGSFKKPLSLGGDALVSGGGEDVFLLRLGPKGNHLWSRAYGGPGKQKLSAIGIDGKRNIVLAGTMDAPIDLNGKVRAPETKGGSNLFLARLNESGAHLYSRVIHDDGAGAVPVAMAVDANGHTTLVGRFVRRINLGGGPFGTGLGGVFIARYNDYCAHRWSKVVGSAKTPNTVVVRSVALDSDGNALVAGSFENEIDFGAEGKPIKIKSAGKNDIFVAKYDPSGEVLWAKRFGDADANFGLQVVASKGGEFFTVGVNHRKIPGEPPWRVLRVVELSKLDASGKVMWKKSFGSGKEGIDDAMLAVSEKEMTLVGTVADTQKFGSFAVDVEKGQHEFFRARFDAGEKGSALSAGVLDLGVPNPRAIKYDPNGDVVLAGSIASKPFPGKGPFGFFLSKLK